MKRIHTENKAERRSKKSIDGGSWLVVIVVGVVSIESTRSCHVTLYPVYNVPDRIIPSQTSKHTGGHVREEEGKV